MTEAKKRNEGTMTLRVDEGFTQGVSKYRQG